MTADAAPLARPAACVEFGQLLAGPVRRHAARRLRRRRGQGRGAAGRRPDARVGPPAPQRPLALVVDPRAQQALGHAQPARASAARRSRASCARAPTSCSRTSARHDGEVGPRPRAGARRRNPACIYARVSGYGQTGRYRDRAGLRLGRRGDRPACATSTATPARRRRAAASRSATRSPRSPRSRASCSRCTRATPAARPARSSTRRSPTPASRCSSRRSSSTTSAASCASRPARGCRRSRRRNVYRSSDGKWVVIAANHDTLWRRLAALMGRPGAGRGPALRDPPRARRARGRARRDHRRLGRAAHGGGARRDRQRGGRRVRAGLHGRRHLRRPALPRARAARGHAGRGARRDARAGRGAEAVRDARRRPPARRAGPSAPTTTRCSASWALDERATSTSCRAATGVICDERSDMAYRLGVDVGGTFTDLFLVDDEDGRQWRVKTPSTPARPVRGRARRACGASATRPASAPGELRNIVHGTTVATNAVLESQGRPRRAHHDAGLRADPAPRALADAGPAGRLDHHDQARPAGLAGRHARGGRAHGRARRDARPGRPRAGRRRSSATWSTRGVESLTVAPHQLLRRRPPRARDRRRSSRSSIPASRSRSPPTCCPSSASTSAR